MLFHVVTSAMKVVYVTKRPRAPMMEVTIAWYRRALRGACDVNIIVLVIFGQHCKWTPWPDTERL